MAPPILRKKANLKPAAELNVTCARKLKFSAPASFRAKAKANARAKAKSSAKILNVKVLLFYAKLV